MKKQSQYLLILAVLFAMMLSACGGTAAVEAETSAGSNKPLPSLVQFTGVIDAIDGDQWTVNGQVITVDPAVVRDGTFKIGDTVKVEGEVQADGTLTVTRVELPSGDDDNSNDDNSNDDNGNDDNSNDDNGNDDNSNDDNGNDDNSNDDNSNDDDNSNGRGLDDDNSNDDDNGNDDNSNNSNSNDDDDDNSSGGNGNDDDSDDDNGNDDDNSDDDSNSNG